MAASASPIHPDLKTLSEEYRNLPVEKSYVLVIIADIQVQYIDS